MKLSALDISSHPTSHDQAADPLKPIKENSLSLLNLEGRMKYIESLEEKRKKNAIKQQEHLEHVLEALQRMTLASTPILLTKTTDMLESIHHTKFLANVVPSLKSKMQTAQKSAETLMALRTELEVLREEIVTVQTQVAEKQKDKPLNQTLKESLLSLDSAKDIEHLQTLAAQSETLTDFIEAIIPSDSETFGNREKRALTLPALKTGPETAFMHSKRKIALPVTGTLVRAYGEPDGYGSLSKGLSIATPPQTLVTAPTDGRVLFSGPFRSFQQLLIIDAGHGYHIVLAGMYKVMVTLGQFVLSGEPIARMGNIPEQNAVPLTGGAGMPVCYMEIRRGSIPIDPGPWLDQKTITQITQQ